MTFRPMLISPKNMPVGLLTALVGRDYSAFDKMLKALASRELMEKRRAIADAAKLETLTKKGK